MADTFRGFSKAALFCAFAAVREPHDWRAAIRTTIPADRMAITAAAVAFYTATPLCVVGIEPSGRLLVAAAGYRAGPAGDH